MKSGTISENGHWSWRSVTLNTNYQRSSSKIFLNPFPKRQILDSSILKKFADDNFKFNENGRKFLTWVENAVEKGEIARCEQFLLFPQCFQKTFTTDT